MGGGYQGSAASAGAGRKIPRLRRTAARSNAHGMTGV
jgi:hypothetical protein